MRPKRARFKSLQSFAKAHVENTPQAGVRDQARTNGHGLSCRAKETRRRSFRAYGKRPSHRLTKPLQATCHMHPGNRQSRFTARDINRFDLARVPTIRLRFRESFHRESEFAGHGSAVLSDSIMNAHLIAQLIPD